ncbi:hypothetical protein SLS62_005011 [Diatrype stigma]|uniref:Major facilitator superfamily (MFS) profile domain-containing protein n=1 Tax=Diatrype stigma TaxID=117547 RepID=A0AAN9UTF5_9PEZI
MEPLDIEARSPSAGDEMPIGGTVAEDEKKVGLDEASSSTRASSIIDPAERAADPANGGRGPSQVGADTPITTLYLTFDTPLPTPNTVISGPRTAGLDLPPCPDLAPYADPLHWPRFRKYAIVAMSCTATAATAYAAGSYSPPAELIAAELGATRLGALAGVTTFCFGFALAPMALAPISEVRGRYPVFVTAGFFFTLFQAVCGLVRGLPGMLIARFLTGVGGSVFSTVVGGVIADMFAKADRNTPMALFSGSVLVGTGLGPLIAAAMVQNWGDRGQMWKWIFWHQVIFDFGLMVVITFLFRESRGCVLLSRKARALNGWYEKLESKGVYGVWMEDHQRSSATGSGAGVLAATATTDPEKQAPVSSTRLRRIRWVTKEDEQRGSLTSMITTSVVRPFHLLFTEPIVFFFSLWVSFAWAILYLTFGSVPLVFQRQYNFTLEQSGYVFTAMIASSVPATTIGIYQENILKHRAWRRKTAASESDGSDNSDDGSNSRFWIFIRRKFPAESHESRLYFTCFTSVLLPLGLYLFGFSAQPDIHWMVPSLAIGFASMGIYYIYLATFNYLADIYQVYASSALAAQSFCRNVLGGIFPLVTGALFTNLGEDAAGGLLGAIATVLTIVPWVLVLYGERIRARSSFAVSPSLGELNQPMLHIFSFGKEFDKS